MTAVARRRTTQSVGLGRQVESNLELIAQHSFGAGVEVKHGRSPSLL